MQPVKASPSARPFPSSAVSSPADYFSPPLSPNRPLPHGIENHSIETQSANHTREHQQPLESEQPFWQVVHELTLEPPQRKQQV